MSKINEILQGWGNVIKDRFNAVDINTKALSVKRLVICDNCDIRSGNSCSTSNSGKDILTGDIKTGCGCNISAKTLSPSSKCPLSKW